MDQTSAGEPEVHVLGNSNTQSNEKPPCDPDPLYKAKILVEVDKEECEALCDTGCQRTCISEKFILKHPNLFKNEVLPFLGKTVSIDGSKVQTLGIINIAFRIKGRHMRANCRIVRNLVYDFVLGWDFFSRHKCSINPGEGYVAFENERVDFIRSSLEVSSTHCALAQDTVIPAFSKVVTPATYYINPEDKIPTSDTVEVEPLPGNSARVAVGRTLSKVQDGHFPMELLNPFPTPILIKAHEVLGNVSFTTDAIVSSQTQVTGSVLAYVENPKPNLEANKHPTPTVIPPPPHLAAKDATPNPEEKPKFNYSTVAKDAGPYMDKLKELLEVKHVDTFSKSDRDFGRTDLVSYHAHMKPGPPICVPPYRATPQMQMEMDKIVHEMLANGLVSHSTSSFSAPVLLVPKKLGGWRFVTDFRKVNARCERVVYPLPRIEDSLRKLKEPKFFSTMDLQKGFWQVPIKEEDRKYFAFSTGTMHVEYNVMPMGALNSSSTMQALMSLILRGLPPEHVLCFLDDILVASSTMEEHLQHLDLVLGAIARAGLKLNSKKCLFAQEEVICLGHRLSRDGIGPDPANLEKIRKWKPPQNCTEVRQFLGLTGYYRQLIKDYAKIADPLTNLTKKDAEWLWSVREQTAFISLRDYLTSSSIMSYPDFTRPFWVKSDASGGGVGYVLTQKHEKKEKVIAYGSKKLTPTQRRYSTYDREFFGVITAVRAYSHYLRHAHFFIVTDHRPLLNLRKVDPKNDATGRRVRWSIELNLYDFDVVYKKGQKHSDADAMSRLDDHDDYAEEEELAGFLEEGEIETLCVLGFSEPGTSTSFEVISSKEKRKELADAQNEDAVIKEVKEKVRLQQTAPRHVDSFYRRKFSQFILVDDVLYLKVEREVSGLNILQAVIPPKLVPRILEEAHGTVFAGHPGIERMAGIIRRNAVWPGLYSDCKRHVQNCPQCDLTSEPNPPPRTELQSLSPQHVFEHVCCDLLQLPPANGWKYVCVFVDLFSRHVSLYKLRDKSATSFTRVLEDYVAHMGCPVRLTCDNGSEFCNELADAAVKVLGVRKKSSVVYRPQSQGNVERMNRELIQQLTRRLHQFKNTWPDALQYVAMAHNALPAAGTGESPNLVFFGRELPLPTFSDLSVNTLRNKSVKQYVEEMKLRVKMVHDAVRDEAAKRKAKSAEYYNQKVKHSPLTPGELVYYRQTPQNRTKIDPKWVGPVRVVARHPSARGTPGTTYTLEFKGGETLTRNYEQLKRVKANGVDLVPREELPAPPAPRIPCVINVDTDDEDPPEPPAPVASRTRSKRRTTMELDVPTTNTTSTRLAHTPCQPMLSGLSGGINPQRLPSHPVVMSPMAPPVVPPPPIILPPPVVLSPLVVPPPPIVPPPSPQGAGSARSSPPLDFQDSFDFGPSLLGNEELSLSWDGTGDAPVGPPVPSYEEPLAPGPTTHLTVPTASRSPSSQGTTPEMSQNTVYRVSPAPPLAESVEEQQFPPTVTASGNTTPTGMDKTPPMAEEGTVQPQAEADEEPQPPPRGEGAQSSESSGVSQSFLESLNVLSEELNLQRGVGVRKIDVLNYKGYEYRCDRATERSKRTQRWCCRYAAKFGCKAKFKLDVADLDDIVTDAVVHSEVPHNHGPFQIESYGLANVSNLQGSGANQSSIATPLDDSHAISRLDEQEFSQDFGSGNLGARTQSSPIRAAGIEIDVIDITSAGPIASFPAREFDEDVAGATSSPATTQSAAPSNPNVNAIGATADLTTVLVDTSRCDARGYKFQAYREYRRDSIHASALPRSSASGTQH